MDNNAFNQSKERGLLLRLEYLKTVFVKLFPEYPEPSRESLLRWSVFDTSIVERAMAIIAVRFARRAPLDIYKTITQEARDQSYVQRRKERYPRVTGGDLPPIKRSSEDFAIRSKLATTEIQRDRVEFLNTGIIPRETFVKLPDAELQAAHNLDDRTSFQKVWSNRLETTIQNSDEFYMQDGLKARVKE
jgi:hypothetical protein